MKSFAEKVKEARILAGFSQPALAEKIGVSARSVQAYEKGEKKPRQAMLAKLARALGVSVKYLTDDECTDPVADIEKDTYIEDARARYGAGGARDVERLLQENMALFAGGDIPQDQKDEFFQAIMNAYVVSKNAAQIKFGRKTGNDS